MLEHIPHWLGKAMSGVRAGHAKLTAARPELQAADDRTIDLSSPAFAAGARLPERFTADGEGVSPPLVWGDVPAGTASLALIVEDPDAPALAPFVHAIVWDLPADARAIAEGEIVADGAGDADGDTGRNSYLAEGWLPPDPPTGHGSHDYVFQLFALSGAGEPGDTPGRGAFADAAAGHVLAMGILVGTYERGATAAAAESSVAGAVPS